MSTDPIPQHESAALTLAAFAGRAPAGHLIEIRHRRDGSMRQRWFPVRQYRAAARYAIEQAGRGDAYASALPRVREGGSLADVAAAYVVWADLDEPDALDRLRAFDRRPSIVTETGSHGHVHAVWQLRSPADPEAARRANLRLAHHLHGDPASCDPARILRIGGTLNHKHDPPAPVRCLYLEAHSYSLKEILATVPEVAAAPEQAVAVRNLREPDERLDDVLLAFSAAEYVPALTGRQVGRNGKATCPFHAAGQEKTPSLHAYDDPAKGWACYGCASGDGKPAGGDIYTFAAKLYGIEPRGSGFHEIRRRLAADLLRREAAA